MKALLDYIASNKEWLFSGAGIFLISAVFTLFRVRRTRAAAGKQGDAKPHEMPVRGSRGFRFEFADGVVAYAKLRTSYRLVNPLVFVTFFKSNDEFLKAMASRVHAKACYFLEKYPYQEAKLRREQLEHELIAELKDQYTTFGLELQEITIGSLVRVDGGLL